jgi:1-acyl-sn-glycerol-3-phosphate acyltransferase
VLTGSQARWYGCPPKAEQRIYFANHQSHADLVMIWAALPEELRSITRPIAARDYWTKSPFRQWITTAVFNAIYVERQAATPGPAAGTAPVGLVPDAGSAPPGGPDPATDAPPPPSPEALRAALPEGDPLAPLVRALESGDSIIIFPEGTRGHGDDPQPFKSGLFRLAQMFPHVVLVPAWINNVQRVIPKGEVVPVPILCSVTFGAPVASEKAGRAMKSAAPSWTVRGHAVDRQRGRCEGILNNFLRNLTHPSRSVLVLVCSASCWPHSGLPRMLPSTPTTTRRPAACGRPSASWGSCSNLLGHAVVGGLGAG